ncbi:MAG TPA: hypothetical protein PK599_06375 [bacterium]|nr:hypothetical protein [bacterium]
MKYYLNTADVLACLTPRDKNFMFGNAAFIPSEVLACETVIVANILRHFPDFDYDRYTKIPTLDDDIVLLMRGILGKKIDRIAARDLVLRYYD